MSSNKTQAVNDAPTFEPTQNRSSLAQSAWPMIHCSPDGTKNGPLPGPVEGDVETQAFEGGTPPIVITVDDDYVYYQQQQNMIDCFKVDDFSKPIKSVNLQAAFPTVGGNVVDDQGRVYFTRFGNLIRFDPGLENPVVSEELAPADALYNGVGFMVDGNLLVTSQTFAHVVSPNAENGKLKVLSTTDLRESAYEGVPTFAPRSFGPRPVYDDSGGVYFNGEHFIAKLNYFPQITQLAAMPLWAFRNPQVGGTFTLSNPILVNDQVWTISQPPADQPMQLFCLQTSNGELLGQNTPFPMALGQISAHTLGAVPKINRVFVICNTEDSSGGVVAIDSSTMDTLWHLPLPSLSEAFAISEASGRLYISALNADADKIEIWSIDIATGEGTVLADVPSTNPPAMSLPSLGPDGNLFYPVLNGCLKIR